MAWLKIHNNEFINTNHILSVRLDESHNRTKIFLVTGEIIYKEKEVFIAIQLAYQKEQHEKHYESKCE